MSVYDLIFLFTQKTAYEMRISDWSSDVCSSDLPERGGSRFLWPVDGRVIAGFGPREGGLHNDGINIAAAPGTEIRAAENGVVVYAIGRSTCRDRGGQYV